MEYVIGLIFVAVIGFAARRSWLTRRRLKSLHRTKDGLYRWQERDGSWETGQSYPWATDGRGARYHAAQGHHVGGSHWGGTQGSDGSH